MQTNQTRNYYSIIRLKIIVRLFGLATIVLVTRLAYLHIYQKDKFTRLYSMQNTATQQIPIRRGDIVDKNGIYIATDLSFYALAMDARIIDDLEYALLKIESTFDINKTRLTNDISNKSPYCYLTTVPYDALGSKYKNIIDELMLDSSKIYKRHYPWGRSASVLVGAVGVDRKGLEGIEYYNNKKLGNSVYESKTYLRDALGRKLRLINNLRSDYQNENIKTNIDIILTSKIYDLLKSRSNNGNDCFVTLIEIGSGDLVVDTEYPGYDPNNSKTFNDNVMANKFTRQLMLPNEIADIFILLNSGYVNWSQLKISSDTKSGIRYVDNNSTLNMIRANNKDIYISMQNKGINTLSFGKQVPIDFSGQEVGAIPTNDNIIQLYKSGKRVCDNILCTPLQLTDAYAKTFFNVSLHPRAMSDAQKNSANNLMPNSDNVNIIVSGKTCLGKDNLTEIKQSKCKKYTLNIGWFNLGSKHMILVMGSTGGINSDIFRTWQSTKNLIIKHERDVITLSRDELKTSIKVGGMLEELDSKLRSMQRDIW